MSSSYSHHTNVTQIFYGQTTFNAVESVQCVIGHVTWLSRDDLCIQTVGGASTCIWTTYLFSAIRYFFVLCNRWDSFFIAKRMLKYRDPKILYKWINLFSILISLKMLKNNVWSYRAMPKHNTLNSSPLSNVEAVKKRKYIIIFHSTLVLLSQITLVILFLSNEN